MPKISLTHPQHRALLRHLETVEEAHIKTVNKEAVYAHDDDLHEDQGFDNCPQCQVIMAIKGIRSGLEEAVIA